MTESTIIVGIDGSPAADHALAWARALGARTGVPVRAVMAWEVLAYRGPSRRCSRSRMSMSE